MSRSRQRWLIGAVLLITLAGLRLPWREADGGNSTFWAYAYFSGDEAAYSCGGRLAYLTGKFLDPEMTEPTTFSGSFAMHCLAYAGYRVAGLTLGAIRWPVMVLAIAAWLAVYVVASRRTPALLAGILVGVLSCNPASLTYERTFSTDVAVGALAVLSYALIVGRRPAGAIVAGILMATACCIKANAVVLLPLVGLAALGSRRRQVLLVLGFAVTLGVWWLGRWQAVWAVSDGRNAAQILADSSRWQYSLADLRYQPADWLNPLSVFPRWRNSMMLGPFVLWALALPAWVALVSWRRGIRQLALPVGMLVYVGALTSQPNNSLRHYLPLLFFVPLLLIQARRSFKRVVWPVAPAIVAFAVLFGLYWFQLHRGWTAEKVQAVMYNDVTVPHNAWLYSGVRLVIGWLILTVALGWRFSSGALILVWFFFANYTISLLSIQSDFVINQLLLQASLAALLFVRGRWSTWYLTHGLILLAFVVGNSDWSQAYRELGTRTYYTRNASQGLTQILPAKAVVVGRRASTILRNTSVRVGLSGFHYTPDEFIHKVATLIGENPPGTVFWLVDGDDDLQWDWYHGRAEPPWNVAYVTTVELPSGDLLRVREVKETLPLIRLHLFRLLPAESPR